MQCCTSGGEEYCIMLEQQVRDEDGFLCVYAVVDIESFASVCNYIERTSLTSDSEQV